MEKIIIIGAGGFGREIKMLIDQINMVDRKYIIAGFVDDFLEKDSLVNGVKILGKINDLKLIDYKFNLVIAVGNPILKRNIVSSLSDFNFPFPNLIHPNVQICSDSVIIGKGCIICASCVLTVNIVIQDFVTFNLQCTVGHDTNIGSFSSFMPSVNISGEVVVCESVFIGTGAKVINKVSIGENSTIGAGAIVVNSIPSNCTAVGMPARPVKF